MNKEELITYISNEIIHGKDIDFEYQINGVPYKIIFLAEDKKRKINMPSILAIPLSTNINNQFVVEVNNLESGNLEKIIEQGGQTGIKLAKLTNNLPSPIIVPLIPSYKDSPYFQQLSQECFRLSSHDRNYRIDNQIISIIDKCKSILQTERGITAKNKIFLNGYSSSGVFAQRFALLHPERVKTVCIGGASGSIPIPTDKFDWPLGIADYETLTGKKFNLDSYSKIKFRYYVGELEAQNKSNSRVDETGNLSPMHDMSYFNRSVPDNVGKQYRKILGIEMLSRAEKIIRLYKELEIDIEHKIFLGRSHNNNSGIGVNELGDKFVNDTYIDSIENKATEIREER